MRYAFGPFVVDTSTLELLREGEAVSVEPQVFEMLVHLIEHRDRVLSKDDLIEAIWGGRIVSDAAISSRIKLVRRAVDDDGTRQAVIKTVHGKGFRFVADLGAAPEMSAAPSSIAEPIPPAKDMVPAPPRQTRLIAMLGLAAAAVLGVIVLVQLFTGSAARSEARIAVLPVSNETGDDALDWAELGLMSLVAHELEARTELSLVKDSTIVTLAERFPATGDTPLTPHPNMTRALQEGYSASHILIARLTGPADNLVLEYQMLNPRGASAPARLSGLQPAELAKEMSRQIAASLPRSGERRLDIELDRFDDAYVAETFARGLDLQMQGKGAEAVDLFRVAAAQAPNNLDIQYELAVSTRMAGNLDSAKSQFEALIERAAAEDNLVKQASAINGLGIVQMTAREDQAALETFQRGLTLIEGTDQTETRAQLLTNIGIMERRGRNYEAAEEALGRALVEFQEAGFEQPPGHLLNSMANLKTQMRDIATANVYYEQALEYHRLVGDRRGEATNLHNLGVNAITLAERDRAKAFLDAALALRAEMGDLRGQMSTLMSLAQLAVNNGTSAQASDYTDQMIALAREAGDDYLLARAHESASHIEMVRKDWEAALLHSRTAQEIYAGQSRTRHIQRERVRQAAILAFSGSTEGRADIDDVLTWALADNQRGTQLHAYEALTVLNLVDGDYQAAQASIDAAVSLAGDMQLTAAASRMAARQGLIRLLQNDEPGAMAALGRAKSGNPDHQETLFLDGALKLKAGQLDQGEDLITAARQTAGDNWHMTESLFLPLIESS